MTSMPAVTPGRPGSSDTADPAPPGRSRASKVRWAVAVFCALGLAINYIDRSAVSVSLPFMTEDFHLTPTEKGLILSAFSWSYALMQIPAGRLIDRFGERVMFGASVLVWSLFTGATGAVNSFGALLGLRLGLGVGEAGAYPAAAKTVSNWFPLRLRSRATSVYDSGARIGSAAATPLIALIIGLWGWRAAFLFAGALGVLWAIGWWAWYRRPEFMSTVNEAELAIIHESHKEQAASNVDPDAKPMRIADLFRRRTVWGMMIGFFCLNFMITFFLTWFPSYLVEERGFNLLKLGVFGMIPPLAAIVGSWVGGLTGDYLLARGWSLNRVRKTCLVGGMLVCSVIALAAVAPQAWQALVLMSISYAASAFTIVTIWCLPADVVDASTVGSLGATQNFFSNIGSALSPIVIGALYGATGTFEVPLVLTGLVVVAGALCFGLLIKRVEPIR
ncbi:MFS transporter [Mycolicibacterium mageritense]|uniref:L-galactonate transporter n=2 Tax=Mycolicibacterium mageritense TaxID=53462 RepID=A0AAI8TY70_MYCME|nr:MFS transporter [Mycolicibacterium mageritense]BDY31080.1 putative L-galactonate transporter [Mycolicibacterium mageritense]